MPEDGTIAVRAGYPPEDMLDEADLAAAKWAWEHNQPAGRGADTLPGAKRLFLPHAHRRAARSACVGIDSDSTGPLLTPDQRRLLDALADQAALAIERVNLAEDVDRGARCGRDRAAALGAAHLDLARSAHAAGLDHRRGHQPARPIGTTLDERDAGRAASRRSRTRPSGSTASSPICST